MELFLLLVLQFKYGLVYSKVASNQGCFSSFLVVQRFLGSKKRHLDKKSLARSDKFSGIGGELFC